MARVISFWAPGAQAGRRTIAHGLADTWFAAGRSVLVVEIAPTLATSEPSEWVERFETLSPQLLRNFLAGSAGSHARLSLARVPESSLCSRLLALLRRAYDWVLWVGDPIVSDQSLAVLDASDLLLWVAPQPSAIPTYQKHLDQLTLLHFPHSYSQLVVNRSPSTPVDRELASFPEERESGYGLWKSFQELASVLDQRSTLFRPVTVAPVSAPAIEQLKQRVQPQLLKVLEKEAVLQAGVAQKAVEEALAQDASLPASREARGELLSRVLEEVLGLGPIEPLLKDPDVSEVMVNGHGIVFVEKKGKLHPVDVQFSSEKQLRTVIDRIVAPIGRRVDESMPLCDARLADGSRVNIVLPPLALDGPVVTIRKFSARSLALPDLVGLGSMSPAMADFLDRAVKQRCNMVVSGGTGSGKTTLLNALSSAIPSDERIVTIEDAAELRLQKPHVIRLESRPPNAEGEGAIPIRRLVINALRMRPDRIVVGECRGGEALDMLQAMNTGHDGSLTTLHANSPRDALGRLETLVLMAGMELPVRVVREQIRSAVHFIIQQARLGDGSRRVTSITEVTGMEGDTLTTQELFRFRDGRHESTGLMPRRSLA